MALFDEFRRHLQSLPLPAGRALVAVSGGPDSTALLDLLHRTSDLHNLELVIAHFDHGIHAESGHAADLVRGHASKLGLPLELGRAALGRGAGETAARAARYAFLHEARRRLDASAIFLAHHADDQAETVLMRVLAGSGPAGLAGMVPVNGILFRPLLPFRRTELAQYLRSRDLSAWVDSANSDSRHQRSWLRTELLPRLRERYPNVDRALVRTAAQARRARLGWDAVLEALPALDVRLENDGISVAGGTLRGYDSDLTEALILAIARRVGCPAGPRRAARIARLLSANESGSTTPLSEGWKAEVSFGRLRLVRPSVEGTPSEWALMNGPGEGRWGDWRLVWRRDQAPPRQERVGDTAWFTLDRLIVRSWKPGERVRPLAGNGRRLVVRCFQEARVPRSRRTRWPVLAGMGEVVWIPGVCRSDALLPPAGSEALRVDAELS